MFRYIIAVSHLQNALSAQALREVREAIMRLVGPWIAALDRPRAFAAFVDSKCKIGQAIVLPANRGAIFGSLFHKPRSSPASEPKAVSQISPAEAESVLRSSGRNLIWQYWGNYVAVLNDSDSHDCTVVRGPVSTLAAFRVRLGSVDIFFSHLDDLIALKKTNLSINWDSITAQVVGGDYLTSETALREIEALECGAGVAYRRDGSKSVLYWDPRSFLGDASHIGFDEAADALRRDADYCVIAHSLASNSILMSLSGGLDSSIVLSSLSRSPSRPSITAVNYYSRGPGDERRFARSMALGVDCRLVERERNIHLDLNRFTECNRTVRPVLNFSAPDIESRNSDLARQIGASAIFNGELGDNLFGSRIGIGAVVEAGRRLGIFLSMQAVIDHAMLTRQSVWHTLSLTRKQRRRVSKSPDFGSSLEMLRPSDQASARSLLLASKEAVERFGAVSSRFVHPWMMHSRRLAPGSHALLFGLIAVTSTSYHSPFSAPSDPQRVSPLASQPLVETALRIPSYLHIRGGQDRAVARAAFSKALPATILNRGLGKGGPTLWAKDIVERNRVFLREYLLDGILVQRRLIDREKLRVALSPAMAKSSVIIGDIFAKLYIEAWLRKFTSG